jgi:hypothetical protein
MALAFVFDIPDGLPPSRLKKAGKRVNGRLLGSWVKPGPRWLVDGKVLVVAPHDYKFPLTVRPAKSLSQEMKWRKMKWRSKHRQSVGPTLGHRNQK